MTFWILITFATALTVGYIWFASAHRLSAGVASSQSATELYQARLAEIDHDVAEGQLDDVAAKDAKAEEGRRLLSTGDGDAKLQTSGKNSFPVAIFLALIPVISISVYMYLGDPDSFSGAGNQSEVVSDENSIEDLVAIAEQRLATHPDDVQGWKVLAPIYTRMGRMADAQTAYREIIRIEGANPANMLALAENMVRGEQGTISQEAKDILDEVLKLDAENSTASFMLGVYQLQQNEPREALKRWQAMVDGAKGDEDWLSAVKQRIDQVNASLAAPSGDAAEAIKNLPKQDQQRAIQAMVEGLAARLEDDPSDKAGWLRLVRAYVVMGDDEKAKAAADQAIGAHKFDGGFADAIRTELQNAEQGEN